MSSTAIANLLTPRRLGAVLLVSLLAGCGGGGCSSTPPGDIAVTAANRDVLTRAAVVSLVGGLALDGITQAGAASAALGSRMRASAADGFARKRAAAATTPVVTPCAISGTSSSSYDDADGDGILDLNEIVTIVYDACRDDAQAPEVVVSGGLVIGVTSTRSSGATVAVTAQAYTTSWPGHSVRLDGGLSLAVDDTSPTTGQLVTAVGNSMVMQVVTPLWSDRLTLQAGYQTVMSIDATTASTRTAASGTVRSEAAGGYVTTRTPQPLVQFSTDPYPRSGRVEVIGKTGSLQATVQSTSLVQIDLDADGNGIYEATTTLGWDEIL